MSMGFARPQCVKALQETNGDQERAVEWIFSHPDDDGSPDEVLKRYKKKCCLPGLSMGTIVGSHICIPI